MGYIFSPKLIFLLLTAMFSKDSLYSHYFYNLKTLTLLVLQNFEWQRCTPFIWHESWIIFLVIKIGFLLRWCYITVIFIHFQSEIDFYCQLKFFLSSIYSKTINNSLPIRGTCAAYLRILLLVCSTLNNLFPFHFPPRIQTSW